MFKSSTKTTTFFPNGGPYTPFRRLSSWPSTMFCETRADVCAEKEAAIADAVSGSWLDR